MNPNRKLYLSREIRTEAGGRLAITAGGAGDNVATAMTWVDRIPAVRGPYMGAKLIISGTATLAAAATLSLTALVRDATSGAGAGAADYGLPVVFGAVATGAGTVDFTAEVDVDLLSAREFIGVTLTGDLSAANTDVANLQAVWAFSGSDRGPISKGIIRGS